MTNEERPAPSGGSFRDAIQQVEQVQADLERTLDDINEILRTLEQAEREKSGSEREIEMLRDAVRRLRGERNYPRPSRPQYQSAEPALTPSNEPAPAGTPVGIPDQSSGAGRIATYLGAVFLVGLGSAAVCALAVRGIAYLLGIGDQVARGLGQAPPNTLAHLASYLIGLPLGLLVLWVTVLRPHGPVNRFLAPIIERSA